MYVGNNIQDTHPIRYIAEDINNQRMPYVDAIRYLAYEIKRLVFKTQKTIAINLSQNQHQRNNCKKTHF